MIEASHAYNQSIAGVRHGILDLWQPEPDVAVVALEVEYRRHDGRTLRLPCRNIFRFREGLDLAPVFEQP
ncbi:hypothetical protein BS329_20810 [Amycolatopsis coloradensis]|uniref:SnoaL-like domain-containing protein n=1 Tax=Amycolatopsis coloradensis TaxID=76021 RepID=A0A1R0KQV8_9PSEU|nr:hypothetical protein [Amycolatopsis coloradensis]OLZ50067.1 hypothetical protein BS329_20810 [Amycolatopsis coloradensis]